MGAEADLETAQSGVTEAQAMLAAAKADQAYWTVQIKRSETLVKAGAISQQENQQDKDQYENANSKVRRTLIVDMSGGDGIKRIGGYG